MSLNTYSVTYPWAPQEAQVTTVGLSLVVTRFIAVQTWHCTFENAGPGSLAGGTCPVGGASDGRGGGTAFRPKRSSNEIPSLSTGLIAEGKAGDGKSGENEAIGDGGAISGPGSIAMGMFSVSGVDNGVWEICSISGVRPTGKGMFRVSGDGGGICDCVSFSTTWPIPGGMPGDVISGDDGGIGDCNAISGMRPVLNGCGLDIGPLPITP